MTARKFTVSRRFCQRRYDHAKVPFIRIAGNWLEQAGFPIGATIQATVCNGQITLSAVSTTHKP